MLRNCYKRFDRQGTSAREVQECARGLMRVLARIRIYVRGASWKSCELELDRESWLDELKDYKLWISVTKIGGRRWEQEFKTVREMRNAVIALGREYVVCEEHYGAHDEIGHSWITHYGKALD